MIKIDRIVMLVFTAMILMAGVVLAGENEEPKQNAKKIKVHLFNLALYDQEILIVPDEKFELLLINRIPKRNYKIETKLESSGVPPIDLGLFKPAIQGTPPSIFLGILGVPLPSCTNFVSIQFYPVESDLESAKTEQEVDELVRKADSKARNFFMTYPNCADPDKKPNLQKLIDARLAKIKGATQRRVSDIAPPGKGQRLIVTINRMDEGDLKSEKEWKFTLTTGDPSPFEILYGFTFVTNGWNKGSEFFSRQIDLGSYNIVSSEMRGWGDFDMSPTVFAAWYPGSGLRKVEWGLMAGIGSANDAVTVAFGPFVTFSRNIGLGCGVAAHRVYELRSKYKQDADRSIAESLDFDQLHEKQWAADVFVTVLFRFDKNPFSSDKKKD